MKNKTQRELEIQKGLEKEIYSKLESLEGFNDDTFSSTEKLANILDGYMTEVEDINVEENDETNNLDEMVILEENEISVEVDDSEVLNEYNAKIHDFNLDTLSDMLEQDKVDKEITKEFTEEELEAVKETNFTEKIISEENIIDLDEDEISEDDSKGYQEDIQELTNKFSDLIDKLVKEKEEDIMSI